jgi:hypothetical protein
MRDSLRTHLAAQRRGAREVEELALENEVPRGPIWVSVTHAVRRREADDRTDLPIRARGASMTTVTTATPAAVASDLLDAIVSRDTSRLRELFTDDVWLRAMLVRETVERHDADAAVQMFQGWFGDAVELEVLHTSTYPVAGREQLTYRFRLRPSWAPGVWHVIEQTGYARIHEGRVRRLDLVCTGFAPEA